MLFFAGSNVNALVGGHCKLSPTVNLIPWLYKMDLIKKYWIAIVVTFGLCMFIKPALCFLILGALISYIGFAAVIFLKKIARTGVDWTGNVIEYQSDRDGHKTPLIEFTTVTGDIIREKPFVYASTDLSKIRTYSKFIDQLVPILYDPTDPKKFVLKNEGGLNYIVFIVFILAGLFFVGLSISWLLGYIKMD